MPKTQVRLMLLVVLALAGIFLAVLSPTAGYSLGNSHRPDLAVHAPQSTPTAAEIGASQPGSTTGIEWMGMLIVAIILLPILVNKRTWKRT